MKPATTLSKPALLPPPVSATMPPIVPDVLTGTPQTMIAAGDAVRVYEPVPESGATPLSIVARDPARLKEAIVSSAASTALPNEVVEHAPVVLATPAESEVRDWKGDVIPPEVVTLYKTMADIMTGLGIKFLYPLTKLFRGGDKTSDDGVYVDFDYSSPHEVRTPYGTFSFSLMIPGIDGIWEAFDRLLHEAFTVVVVTPRRNDRAVSWDAFQHQLTGPVLRLYPKGTVLTPQRSSAEALPSGSVSIGNGLIVSTTQLLQVYTALIESASRDPKIILDFVAAYRRTLAESLPISALRFPIYTSSILRDHDMSGDSDDSLSRLKLARIIMAQLSCDGEFLSITLPTQRGVSGTFHQRFIVGEPISETPAEEGVVRARLIVQMRFAPQTLATFISDCEDSPESIDSAALYRGTGIKCRTEDLVAMRELIKKLVRVDMFSLVMEPASGSDEKPLRILL